MIVKRLLPHFLSIILFFSLFNYLLNGLVETGFLFNRERVLFTDFQFSSIFFSFLAFCFVIPVLEEFSFRAFLTGSPKVIKLGISFFVVVLVFKILEAFVQVGFWMDVGISFLLSFALFSLIDERKIDLDFFSENILSLSIASSLTFAFFHMGLNFSADNLMLLSVSVIPYFFSGLIFCRVRVKFGLIYSVLLHSIVNAFGLFLNLI